jgi:hypothetical protein
LEGHCRNEQPDLSDTPCLSLAFFLAEKRKEESQQQLRELIKEKGSVLDRNKASLDQHRAEERIKRIEERARAHKERWDGIVERHVAQQRREEEARDELILMQSKQDEVRFLSLAVFFMLFSNST